LPPYDEGGVNAVDGGREPSHPFPPSPQKRGEGGPLAVDEGFKVK